MKEENELVFSNLTCILHRINTVDNSKGFFIIQVKFVLSGHLKIAVTCFKPSQQDLHIISTQSSNPTRYNIM